MTTCGWTKGPWTVFRGDDTTYILGEYTNCAWQGRENKWELARIRIDESEDIGRSKAEDRANARLIASAPQIYEALAETIQYAEGFIRIYPMSEEAKASLAKARAALAAARGEG